MAALPVNFNDSDRAKIYVRDRATCCFSGANLWLLDAPLRTGWQSDWVDHKRPISRGGRATLENGVCASHTLNMKKRNNSADTTYFFENGNPTALYYYLYGSPVTHVTERLQRLSKLQEPDWYFNRAVTWIFEALDYKWAKPDYKRTDEYWFDAAYKKLLKFHKLQEKCPSFENRGIIMAPSKTQETLLSIRNCDSLESMKRHSLRLFSRYTRNSQIWWEYFHPEDHKDDPSKYDSQRRKAYDKACKIQDQLTHDTFECIQADYKIRYGSV
jgi:hypothetical protein